MDPLGTLMIIVAAIFIIFITEFRDTFIKITSIPGVKLWVPLLWMSWLVENYHEFIHALFLLIASNAQLFLYSIASSKLSLYAIQVALLFLVGFIPLCFLYWRANFKFGKRFTRRKISKKHPITHCILVVLWIIIATLVVVYQNF